MLHPHSITDNEAVFLCTLGHEVCEEEGGCISHVSKVLGADELTEVYTGVLKGKEPGAQLLLGRRVLPREDQALPF